MNNPVEKIKLAIREAGVPLITSTWFTSRGYCPLGVLLRAECRHEGWERHEGFCAFDDPKRVVARILKTGIAWVDGFCAGLAAFPYKPTEWPDWKEGYRAGTEILAWCRAEGRLHETP